MSWYTVKNEHLIDTPALLVYPDRIRHNIEIMIGQVGGDPKRLMPHIKTHKMPEVVRMQLEAGIERFKCATIAELEMALEAGARSVLMAYPLTGPKIDRFLELSSRFPNAGLASLVDNLGSAQHLAERFSGAGRRASVYLDVNNGQHRTGNPLSEATFEIYQTIAGIPGLELRGLHVYDGHVRDQTPEARLEHSNRDFSPVYTLVQAIEAAGLPSPEIITGGSPSFMPASRRNEVFCSPGTTLLWDWGYANLVPELPLQWAALLMTRVISKPSPGLVTTDLGHKAVGSENPIDKRVFFLNLSGYQPVGQSEEHLVLKVDDWEALQVGDVLYGVPYHVCPSVALYDLAQVIENQQWTQDWEILARRRKISV